jgi:hypothetical protein
VEPIERVRAYYEDLNTGDPDLVARHFTEDATHYYTRLSPHRGGRAIAESTKLAVEGLSGQWFIEDAITDGDRVVIEWTMTWKMPHNKQDTLDRGTEWFEFRDGLICEVRAYHHGGKKNPTGGLVEFDHTGRGYTTL